MIFNCWITTITPLYEASLLAELVNRGFTVSTINPVDKVVAQNNGRPAVVIGLSLYKENIIAPESALSSVMEALNLIKSYYHSIVISESVYCAWTTGNYILPSAEDSSESEDRILN